MLLRARSVQPSQTVRSRRTAWKVGVCVCVCARVRVRVHVCVGGAWYFAAPLAQLGDAMTDKTEAGAGGRQRGREQGVSHSGAGFGCR